ncbi:MAG: sugar ABC transporter permease [Hungatella sp.]|nr:sugar ABC transporter permease [Hungatella sp.]
MRKKITPWLFLAPSLLGVIGFMGIPFLDVIRRSFLDVMGRSFVGAANYQAVWRNEAFLLAAGNTLRFLAVCIPLLMAVSLGLALLLAGKAKEARDYGIIRTTMVLPLAVPAASMVLIWKMVLCRDGVLNQWLSGLTGELWDTDWAFSGHAFPVLTATYLWKHTGYDMILWLAGLAGIPDEMYEAARIDGAGAMARFRYITVPCLAGTFCLVGILSVVNSFRVYREAYLLAGPYPDASIYLIPHLFAHWFLNLDIQKMTAAAVIITAAFLIPGGLGWLLARILSAGERKGE